MRELNLPGFEPRIRISKGRQEIFDPVRKKHVRLTPEEWVRQHFLHFLIDRKKVPASLIAVETSVKYNQLAKRCDIVVFDRKGRPVLIVECKAPEVAITPGVFRQVAMYNLPLMVRFLVMTNGIDHYSCSIDYEKGSFRFIEDVPDFETIDNP
jgi:hypothetical protein